MLRFALRRESRRWSIELRIHGSAEVAWAVITDTRLWPVWGPSVTGVEVQGLEYRVHQGMQGHVRTLWGGILPFEIHHVVPGRSWSWRVGGIEATGHEIVPARPAECWIVFTVPLWAWAYAPICLWAARRIAALVRQRSSVAALAS